MAHLATVTVCPCSTGISTYVTGVTSTVIYLLAFTFLPLTTRYGCEPSKLARQVNGGPDTFVIELSIFARWRTLMVFPLTGRLCSSASMVCAGSRGRVWIAKSAASMWPSSSFLVGTTFTPIIPVTMEPIMA